MLGQLAAEAAMVKRWSARWKSRNGTALLRSDRHTLYSAQVLTQQLYPKAMHTLRDLAGGGMIMQPSSYRDFEDPEIAELIEATQQSPVSGAFDKVKFYKLAWDAVGSEFGSRHTQYEMFYAGATFVTEATRTGRQARATALVDAMLKSYDLPAEVPLVAAR